MSQSQLQPPRLLEQMRVVIRARHYSLRTEETYLGWVKRHASGAANSWSDAGAEAVPRRLQQSMIVCKHSSPKKRVPTPPRLLL